MYDSDLAMGPEPGRAPLGNGVLHHPPPPVAGRPYPSQVSCLLPPPIGPSLPYVPNECKSFSISPYSAIIFM